MQIPSWLRIGFAAVFLFWILSGSIIELLVDWNWFESIGHLELFSTRFFTQIGLWVLTFIGVFAFIFGNIAYASKIGQINLRRLQEQLADVTVSPEQLKRILGIGHWVVSVLPALLFASVAAQQWLYCLAFFEPIPFDKSDPIFDNEISFYVFQLPMINFVVGIVQAVGIMTAMIVGLQTFVRDVMLGTGKLIVHPKSQAHVTILIAGLFLIFGVEWYLQRFDLLFSKEGVVWGVGYADVNARIPAFLIMSLMSFGVVGALLWSIRKKDIRLPSTVLVGYFLIRVLVTGAWPSLIQDYMVEPNELEYETPYLERNIEFTREAFALDRIEVRPFEAAYDLTMSDIQDNPLTINNVRVWDDRPLLTTYSQLQEIRTYYDFRDVDVDRYVIDNELRQVMLSARELNYNSIPSQAKSWVNEHFQYTHGYGLTMSPVNLVTKEGLPSLFVQDIPPVSSKGIDVQRPEVYYGEMTDSYVIVKGSLQEFDYPKGDENVKVTYAGDGGVGISSLWRKFLFAVHFGSVEMLLSNYIQDESRILFRRQIFDRVENLAPFLYYDKDPYLVVVDGRMFWMMDAYTVTDQYPYSEPAPGGRFNYIRNSVKVVVDAYHGTVNFYISDPTDPLIRVYDQIFPNTFQDLSALPEGLKEHLRYPVDFFETQARMYQAYHMMDPTVFYNKEDLWEKPKELYAGKEQRMQSYYLIMKLPEAEKAEFILLLPFVPSRKDNMISWMAARCDDPNYGSLVLYQFPKQKLIYGPRQIEARIDQDPEISKQLTLWSQSGSSVVRGNLLVIPIGNSLVYVEPLYLQAESSQLPELKRVIVSYDKRIAMEASLSEALLAVFEGAVNSRLAEPPEELTLLKSQQTAVQKEQQDQPWDELAAQANDLLQRAKASQQSGDWSGYGQSLEQLTVILQQLDDLAQGNAEEPSEEPVETAE